MGRGYGLIAVLAVILFLSDPVRCNSLKGVPYYCHNEGAQVKIPGALARTNSRLVCMCKNHKVQCSPLSCPSTEGCYRVKPSKTSECCPNCLGCSLKGMNYTHGQVWENKCHVNECQAGVLTSSRKQCLVPCSNPLPPGDGDCCPSCRGCWMNGIHVAEGSTISSPQDSCVKCSCKNGLLTCSKQACPILSCPPNRAKIGSDGCCSVCNGSRELYVPPGGRCFLGRYLYHTGENRTFDSCSTCTCDKGYLTCERKTCPPQDCPPDYLQIKKGECCPSCSYPMHLKVCLSGGVYHKHGDVWRLDNCASCNCTHGQIRCRVDQCEGLTKECPRGTTKRKSDGDCCPRCVDDPGVCVVYGEPHFKTFDDYFFDFHGECRYELAKDCSGGRSFSILLNNDARQSVFYPWPRSLSLKLVVRNVKRKVSLSQKLRTKVDHKRVKLPFYDKEFNITRKGFLLTLNTITGIQINWDGAGYVEIKLDAEWQNKTCGLCGNFNKDPSDDRKMKDGKLASTSNVMASSWQSRRSLAYYKRLRRLKHLEEDNQIRTQRLTCFSSQTEVRRRCSVLNETYFDECHTKVAVDSFYKSCLVDLCDCPSHRRCECDAIVAYVRECERAKIKVTKWKVLSKCGGLECPFGSVYMKCAPACKPSCRNPTPNPNCHKKRCRPGCYCSPPTVLHRGTCVLPKNCPLTKKTKKRSYKRTKM